MTTNVASMFFLGYLLLLFLQQASTTLSKELLELPINSTFHASDSTLHSGSEFMNYTVNDGTSKFGRHSRKLLPGAVTNGCTPTDISISQGKISGVGIPVFQVEILNTCPDTKCSMSNIIVHCGLFASASLVPPNVFRRLDPAQGTCIANNGKPLPFADTLVFSYEEEFMQPLRLKSAHVSCRT